MIPEELKYIDKLRTYKDGALKLLWFCIKDREKREDIKVVMTERGLLK